MDKALSTGWAGAGLYPSQTLRASLQPGEVMAEQEARITETIGRERGRLRSFIRRRVADEADAEDILQDVFYEFIEAYRMMKPIEQAGAWLFRVARNRIIDRFRKKKREPFSAIRTPEDENGDPVSFEDLLPSPDAGPEAVYARDILLDQLDAAIDELPVEQRDVFVANEIEGVSFKEMAAETGVNMSTLLSRKHLAVRHLRKRLETIYKEFRS